MGKKQINNLRFNFISNCSAGRSGYINTNISLYIMALLFWYIVGDSTLYSSTFLVYNSLTLLMGNVGTFFPEDKIVNIFEHDKLKG